MSNKMFRSICSQLADLRWSGFIELFVLNEPMADPLIRQRAAQLRESCPQSTIYVSTNGDAIVRGDDPIGELRSLYDSGVTSVNLNVYDSGKKGDERAALYNSLVEKLIATL